jgi:MFS transporter, DHA1 family, multidrug resistance protein
MCSYTFAMYCAASIIAPAEAGMIDEFKISAEAALVTFAVFVLGYGVGPLVFAPLSEIPVIGRNAVRPEQLLV